MDMIQLHGVAEYIEEIPVFLAAVQCPERGERLVIRAYYDNGECHTDVDLMDLFHWLEVNLAHVLYAKH